jgi:tRNA pseudouridine38-40 synthase
LKRIRLDLSYDGRDYHGFQSQPDGKTIQDEIERALALATRVENRVTGASRTDSGVSAEHQVCTVDVPDETDLYRLQRSLNGLLPKTIRIQSIVVPEPGFHPGFLAKAKVYRYRLWLGECLDPFCRPFVWEIKSEVDFERLVRASEEFVGKHDFKAFSNAGTDVESTIREIFGIHMECRDKLVNIWVLGDGFLKQMIRNIVGTCVDVSLGKLNTSIADLLSGRERADAGRTAPALGLQLVEIFYDAAPELASYVSRYNQRSAMLIGSSK